MHHHPHIAREYARDRIDRYHREAATATTIHSARRHGAATAFTAAVRRRIAAAIHRVAARIDVAPLSDPSPRRASGLRNVR